MPVLMVPAWRRARRSSHIVLLRHYFIVFVPVLFEGRPDGFFDDAAEEGEIDFEFAVAELGGLVSGGFAVAPDAFEREQVGEVLGLDVPGVGSFGGVPGADFLPGEHFGLEHVLHGFWNLAVGAHFEPHVNFAVRVVAPLEQFGVRQVRHGLHEVIDVSDAFVDEDIERLVHREFEKVFGMYFHVSSVSPASVGAGMLTKTIKQGGSFFKMEGIETGFRLQAPVYGKRLWAKVKSECRVQNSECRVQIERLTAKRKRECR